MRRTLCASLLVCAAIAAQQRQVPDPAPVQAPPTTVLKPAASSSEAKLVDADGTPLPNITLNIKVPAGQDIQATTDAAGNFNANLALGSYQVYLRSNDLKLNTEATVTTPGELKAPFRWTPKGAMDLKDCPVNPMGTSSRWLAPGLLLLYWVIVIGARYHNIIKVNRNLLLVAVNSTEQEVAALTDAGLKNRALALIRDAKNAPDEGRILPFFFGMRGQVAAGWIGLNDAQRIMTAELNREGVLSRLRLVVEELRPEYSKVADKIDAVLLKEADAANPSSDDFLRATLSDGLRAANEKKQSAITDTLNWQNKAFTLIFIGACLLVALASLLNNSVLLLVGFAGGFASRLMRGKSSPNAAVDAELSWTTLFLSPIYGAFTGWGGILILAGLKDLQLLGDRFKLDWNDTCQTPVALALAFLFGFSERYFSAITDLAEKAVLQNESTKAADTSSGPKPPAASGAGIPRTPPPISPGLKHQVESVENDRQSETP